MAQQIHGPFDELLEVQSILDPTHGRDELYPSDPDRLAQALRNLLRNAIVHTDPGGIVRVTAAHDDGGVRLTVDDDGPGIPMADRERVFDRLARLDRARSRDHGGAGLGLAIVRAIVNAHGGEIWIERSPEGGARFIIELPV